MSRIVPLIDTLDQHLFLIEHQPEIYRPSCCPYCSMDALWSHGHYLRNADREGVDGEYLDPVPILRYLCSHCWRTCSRLPSCIPPRRWYLWRIQQAALILILSGSSLRAVTQQFKPGRRTIGRWWHWLHAQYTQYSFHLRNRFPELGRHASRTTFWSACLKLMSLADAMAWLDRDGVIVP